MNDKKAVKPQPEKSMYQMVLCYPISKANSRAKARFTRELSPRADRDSVFKNQRLNVQRGDRAPDAQERSANERGRGEVNLMNKLRVEMVKADGVFQLPKRCFNPPS